MVKAKNPRHGSMQFWPRVRAKKHTPRRRSWATSKEVKPLGFIGYKSAMFHVIAVDNRPKNPTKGEQISYPVTLVECPPMKVAGVVFYKKNYNGSQQAISCVLSEGLDKELGRKISLPKKTRSLDSVKEFDDIRLLIFTQPKLTGIGSKKPQLSELALGGSLDEKVTYAKEKLGKQLPVEEIFKEGQQLDVHAITKGKGFQGPVRIFGVSLTNHKSEKSRRTPGSLGPWNQQGHILWRVAHAMKHGHQLRTEYNKWLLKIETDVESLNPASGIHKYGKLKTTTLLIKGSLPGSSKRPVSFTPAIRPNPKLPKEAPRIVKVIT